MANLLIYPPIAPLGSDDLFPGPGAGFYPHRSIPPGGRYDPIGPPGVPGFEPSSFVRRPRRPPGGSTHPDLEFFQQGPDF
nr:unnamed protein product [Digitaria exilis]